VSLLPLADEGRNRTSENVQVNFSMSFDVPGNFSIAFPVFSETSGCNFSSFEVSWLFATRATLLALTAFVLISSFSSALEASSPFVEPAVDGAAELAVDLAA